MLVVALLSMGLGSVLFLVLIGEAEVWLRAVPFAEHKREALLRMIALALAVGAAVGSVQWLSQRWLVVQCRAWIAASMAGWCAGAVIQLFTDHSVEHISTLPEGCYDYIPPTL